MLNGKPAKIKADTLVVLVDPRASTTVIAGQLVTVLGQRKAAHLRTKLTQTIERACGVRSAPRVRV
jgi:hypothetical protein